MLFLTGLISCLVVSVLIKHCRVQSSASAVVMVTLLFGALQSLTPQQSFEEPARWFVSAVKITFCSDFSETAAAFPRISNLTDFFPDTTMESSYFTFRLCRKSLRGHNFLSSLLAFMVLLCQYRRSQSLGVSKIEVSLYFSFILRVSRQSYCLSILTSGQEPAYLSIYFSHSVLEKYWQAAQ